VNAPKRLYYCQFPGCRQSYETALGRKIHQTLAGHQRRRDRAANGDEDRPGPRHPAYRQDPPAAAV
jgi:hypothetical protein